MVEAHSLRELPLPFGKEPRRPTGRQGCREGEPQWRAGTVRDKDAAFRERGDDPSAMARADADETRHVAARKLTAVEDGFEDPPRLGGEGVNAHLLLSPE